MRNISLKFKHRQSVDTDKPMPVYAQIIYQRKTLRYPLPFTLAASEWDSCNECVRLAAGTEPARLVELLHMQEKLDHQRTLLWQTIRRMEESDDFSLSLLLAQLQEQDETRTWKKYLEKLAARSREEGHACTARHYLSTLHSFLLFLESKQKDDLPLEETGETLLMQYQEWMVKRNLAPNTISFYLRNLRSAWNKAISEGLIEYAPSPFTRVNTSIAPTAKRAVEETTILRIAELAETDGLDPGQAFACDMFLFSYYARGMAFVDLAYLTPDNIKGNKLVYKRRKTGQELQITLLPEMKKLIKRYRNNGTPYLFPILKNGDSPSLYESALRLQNKRLKKIGKKIGVEKLTTYVSRHSWASIALQKGVPIEMISEGMGHSSVKVTRIYIALLDNPWLDYANEVVVGNKKKKYVNGVRKGNTFWRERTVSW